MAKKGHIAWNKGLTAKQDERIARYSKKLEGIVRSEKSNEKNRIAHKKLWQDPNSPYNKEIRLTLTKGLRKGKKGSNEFRNKISKVMKKKWQNPAFLFNSKKHKEKLSLQKKKEWANPHSTYNSKEWKINRIKGSKKMWQDTQYREKTIKAQREGMQLSPNKPEKAMMQIIKENKFPFNYVGDGKVILGGFNPDFLSKNPKHIIEVNGDYWHNLPKVKEKDKRKLRAYASLGYKTMIVWEHELREPEKVAERMERFLR